MVIVKVPLRGLAADGKLKRAKSPIFSAIPLVGSFVMSLTSQVRVAFLKSLSGCCLPAGWVQ